MPALFATIVRLDPTRWPLQRVPIALLTSMLILATLPLASPVEAQTGTEPDPPLDAREVKTPTGAEQNDPEGYPAEERQFDNPTDVDQDLDDSFPKRDSVLPQLKPPHWPEFKRTLYKKFGLKVGFSYQTIFQYASETLPGRQDVAGAGWFLFEAKWEAIRRGQDFQGSVVMAVDGRHAYGDLAVPGNFRLNTGSVWATDSAWFEWDPYVAILFWEQWLEKDRFVLRIGQQSSASVFDFFRFGDFRTSFSNSQLSFAAAIIPFGPPGPGINFKWWPMESSELYVVGAVTDINAPAGEWDWSRLFDFGQVFAGVEIGYNWRRGEGDFDHVHLDVWYGDEVDTAPYPSKSGWGFKLHGSKQWNSLVAFANYGYNTSYGGGFGFTNSRHAANLGVGFLKPLGINGEVAMNFSWAQPQDRPDPLLGFQTGRDQYGLEANWKILLTPDLWVTPGLQLIFNPTYDPSTDFIAMPQIKMRLFF